MLSHLNRTTSALKRFLNPASGSDGRRPKKLRLIVALTGLLGNGRDTFLMAAAIALEITGKPRFLEQPHREFLILGA